MEKAVTHDDLVYYACNRLLDAKADGQLLTALEAAEQAFKAFSRKSRPGELSLVAKHANEDYINLTIK